MPRPIRRRARAHADASRAYRPPARMPARDMTRRFPFCGQLAWCDDLDHTLACHKGGRTCSCNLGLLCSFHHLIVVHRWGWTLQLNADGTTAPGHRGLSRAGD